MSESAARFREPIDLDEFEQRLRAGTPSSNPAKTEDPLAELARLVGQADPFRAATVAPQLRPAASRVAGAPARLAVPHLQQVHPPLDRADPPFESAAPLQSGAPAVTLTAPDSDAHLHEQQLPYEPVYAVADLHGGETSHLDIIRVPDAVRVVAGSHSEAEDSGVGVAEATGMSGPVPHPSVIAAGEGDLPRRSWRGVIILSAVLATGFAGLAAALTMKGSLIGGTASIVRSGHEPPMILAGGPTKVQPPKNAADVPDDQPSVLDKTASTKPAKAKLVDSAEQPVDLSQQPTRSTAAQSSAAPTSPATAVATADSAGTLTNKPAAPQVASLDPVAATPGAMGSRDGADAVSRRADSEPPRSPTRNGFPEPRRVKVVSVRPDGSIIGSEPEAQPASSQAAASTPALPAAAAQGQPADTDPPPIELGVAMPQAPTLPPARDKPPVVDAAPSVQRTDAPTPSPQAEKPAANGRRDDVAALIDSPKGGKPAAEAAAPPKDETPTADATAAKPKHGRKKGTEVADLGNQDKAAAPEAATDDAGGKFAAQLAASPTESAAKATLRKLKKKYGSTFGNHKLSYRRVRVDGKTVYRVRLTGLTKDDAGAVCSKLQDDGGTCFVAR